MSDEKDLPWTAETGGPSDELFETLADVLREEEEKARLREDPPPPWGRRHQTPLLILLLLLTALSIYLWIIPPGWLAPEEPLPLASEQVEAGLRVELYLEVIRVRSFEGREGRLPNSLEEAGEAFSAVHYERLDADRFRLWLDSPGGTLSFRSDQSLDAFLGEAPRIVRGEE